METEDERQRRAVKDAYALGRRESDIDNKLRSHENRLNVINGSIARHAEAVAGLQTTVDDRCSQIEDKLDKLIADRLAEDAVQKDRDRQLEKVNNKQISSRGWYIGIATLVLMLAGVIVSLLTATHAFS